MTWNKGSRSTKLFLMANRGYCGHVPDAIHLPEVIVFFFSFTVYLEIFYDIVSCLSNNYCIFSKIQNCSCTGNKTKMGNAKNTLVAMEGALAQFCGVRLMLLSVSYYRGGSMASVCENLQ